MSRPLTEEEKARLNAFDGYDLVSAVETLDSIHNVTGHAEAGSVSTLREQLVQLHEHIFRITVGKEDYLPRAESIALLLQKTRMTVADIYMNVEKIGLTLASLEEILPKDKSAALKNVH